MRGEDGFSLLEAVIGFAIAAVAVVALLQVYASSATAGARSSELLTAMELAETAVDRFDAARSLSAVPDAPVEERGLVWHLSAVPVTDPGAGSDLLSVTVTVTARGAAGPVFVLRTLRHAAPPASGGGA